MQNNVTLFESCDGTHLLALLNPYNMMLNGLTFSSFAQHSKIANALGLSKSYFTSLMNSLILPYLMDSTKNMYIDYKLATVNFRPVIDDQVLITVQLYKNDDNPCDLDCKNCNCNLDVICKDELSTYIDEYAFWYEEIYKRQLYCNYIFSFNSLSDILDIYELLNIDECESSEIYKHNDKYYAIINDCSLTEMENKRLYTLLEFGTMVDENKISLVKEHGKYICSIKENKYDKHDNDDI